MDLIQEYIELANAWEAAMHSGDAVSANSLHDRAEHLFNDICKNQQQHLLFERAETGSESACLFVASHLKESDPPRALNIYKRLLRSQQPFIAISAKYILKEMNG